jgi:hypothetical protein
LTLTKYFKAAQKLILKPLPEDAKGQTVEHLTTYLAEARGGYCD